MGHGHIWKGQSANLHHLAPWRWPENDPYRRHIHCILRRKHSEIYMIDHGDIHIEYQHIGTSPTSRYPLINSQFTILYYIFQMAIQKSLEAQLKHLKTWWLSIHVSLLAHDLRDLPLDSVVWAGPAYLLAKSTTPAPALEQLAPNSPPVAFRGPENVAPWKMQTNQPWLGTVEVAPLFFRSGENGCFNMF